jgi:L-lactate dehydrogenase (cytochrome)
VIKGVLSPSDAQKTRGIGADALMISNHGGRQLNSAPAPVNLVRPFRDAISDSMQLVVDGGIRRGKDVVKALGADACSFGKAYLYGLAAGGQPGVERALELLKNEFVRTMTLLGCTSVADLGEKHLIDLK